MSADRNDDLDRGPAPSDEAADSRAEAAERSTPRVWEQGRASGFDWAAAEARRGYLHPLEIPEGTRAQIVVEHAQEAFASLCRGRPRPFIRGFIQGIAQFWSLRNGETGCPETTALGFPCETALIPVRPPPRLGR